MSKLYACIVIVRDEERGTRDEPESLLSSLIPRSSSLVPIAQHFAHRIEVLEDSVLFDISGLQNRIGTPAQIAQSILKEMQNRGVQGNIAVASSAQTAILYARSKQGVTVIEDKTHQKLPLESLGIARDTLNVFHALGLETTEDLKRVPENELIARYGPEFRKIVDLINQNGVHVLTPNLKEKTVAWDYNLDFPVDDFERLIFILGHGLGRVLDEAASFGFSSEQIDISLALDDKTTAEYSIKLSFPTTEKSFWLKLINLRIGGSPPPCEIVSIRLVCHFAKPRAIERGLFSATRPEPESLLLTVDKIRNLVGPDNVGVPVLVNQRLPEAFGLDAEKLPSGKEQKEIREVRPVLALAYFRPPLPADIRTMHGRLIYLSTPHFAGRVTQYGGVWRESSQWWTRFFWQKMEWDVELENKRIYRLARNREGWFVTGEYD